MRKSLLIICLVVVTCGSVIADNPLITHLFTADPSAHVFDGVLYVYPSHDIDSPEGVNDFSMEDYHVFSTTDLMNFKDHGVALHQDDVPWGDPNNTMWAPDCNKRGTNYYFYFPMNFKVGVAISDSPTGPFIAEPASIPGANAIDPCIFIDDDPNQTPYLYYGGGTGDSLRYMRLKNDMVTPDSGTTFITGLSTTYKEGAFVFKRNGIYYLTYPDSISGSEEIRYATGSSPAGPFTVRGTILDRWTDDCWTSHHSIVEYLGQWYLFYHHKDISGDKTLRSICSDRLYFNGDGTIQKVTPTRRGVGIRKADESIQIDRYLTGSSGLSTPVYQAAVPSGFYLSGIDENNWINYPDVDFGTNGFAAISARVAANKTGGTIEVRVGSTSGTLLGVISVPDTGGTAAWEMASAALTAGGQGVTGIQDLYLVFKGSGSDLFNVDWVRFDRPSIAHLFFSGNGVGEVVINGSQAVNSYDTSAQIDAPIPVILKAAADGGSLFDGWTLNGSSIPSIRSLYAGDVVTASFSADTSGGNPDELHLEAEDFSSKSAVIQTESCDEGGSNIGYIENDTHVLFNDVSFSATADTFLARVASGSSGGTLSVHLDDINAAAICSLPVTGTGVWSGWQEWYTVSSAVAVPAGTYDIYFKFTGGSGYLMNVNWFQLEGTDIQGEPVTNSSGYSLWLDANGMDPGSGYGEDDDGDGLDNLFEYALDLVHSETNSAMDTLDLGSAGMTASHIDKLDVDVRLLYKSALTNSWDEQLPSLAPTSMPANTVYYFMSTNQPAGFYQWVIEAP